MNNAARKKTDAIIVGGGLAGIHLALAMDRIGMVPLLINRPEVHSSSRIAAGIINPITGRRFALTWLYDDLEPVFKETYQYWENKLKSRFFQPVNIYRSVPENKLVNDLDAKLTDPAYQEYCRKMTDEEIQHLSTLIHLRTPGYVMKGYQLDTTTFLDEAIKYLTGKDMYLEAVFPVSRDLLMHNTFTFEQYYSDKIIWATGASIIDHPLFSQVKMNPNKGEVLHLKFKETTLQDIVKQSAFFVPLKNDKIWVGSWNSWDFKDDLPSTEGLNYLQSNANILKVPYTITDHLAAVRPAVEDRRPVIGGHPDHPNIFLFNGFGSKGASLIPYFAKSMVEYFTEGKEILPEVRISRYF